MKVKFRYGAFDRRVWVLSTTTLVVFGGVCAWLFLTAGGAYYLAAWVAMTGVVLGALCMLSVPWRIWLSEEELELRSLVDVTYIPLRSIVDVEVVGEEALGSKIPLVGAYGLLGYYGRYLDLKRWKFYRVYATKRRGCVVIHTTKRRYAISCRTPEMLRTMIWEMKRSGAQE